MTVKTLLVCLTTKEHAGDVLKVAVPLARRTGAHLVGLHTLESLEVYPGIAMHITKDIYQSLAEGQLDESHAIEAIFKKHTEAEDFVSEYRVLRAKATSAAERMVESARAADLVIMAHGDKEVDRYDQRRAQADVIQQSGRPVVVVPLGYDGPEIGSKILLGWSDTREAARAAHDLLLAATPEAEIDVLRVGPASANALNDADILDVTTSLARHGHKVAVHHEDPGGQSIADVLMSKAFELGSDLIVTGAFGHSSVYDFVVGATSRALLRDAQRPVLFSK